MDVGTAKPTREEREMVPHHLLDVVAPTENYSAAAWLAEAEKVIRSTMNRGRRLLFCGGTGLYMKALLDGLFQAPKVDPVLRESLTREGKESGTANLHLRLAEVDSVAAALIHQNDLRRIVRALEVYQQTGIPISELRRLSTTTRWRCNAVIICIQRPMNDLENRITLRTSQMFKNGLLQETRRLLDAGCTERNTSMQGLGYKECMEHLRGSLALDETKDLVALNTRRFAKRQGTWFRKEKDAQWISWETLEAAESVVERILEHLQQYPA